MSQWKTAANEVAETIRVLALQVPKGSLDNVKQLIDEVATAFKRAAPATRDIFDNLADDVEVLTDESSSSSSSSGNSDAALADHSVISNTGAPKRKRYCHKRTAAKRLRWSPNTDSDARSEVLPKTQRGYTRAEFPLWCSTPKKPGLAAPTRPRSPVSSIDSSDAAAPAVSNDPVGSAAWQPIVLSD